MVAPKNENGVVIEQAGTGLGALLDQLKCWRVRVVPFVCFDVKVFATSKLNLFVSVIAAKRIDDAFVGNSREKCFFLRHSVFYVQLAIAVHKGCVAISVATKDEPGIELVYVDCGEVAWK